MKPNHHRSLRPRLLALATTTALALCVPGLASAQTAKEQELEARIAQLEAQVQALLSQQQQTATEVQEVRTAQAAQPAAPARATAPAGSAPIQATTITPRANPGTVFTVGGMIRMDAMATKTTDGDIAKGTAGRDFYVPGAIPVGGNGPETYSDAHMKFSRLWLDASTTLDSGDRLGARLELDFFGGSLGNTAATNTYGATLRHAYVTWNNWLAGQTWSNFQDVAALPEAVDFVGVTEGTTFVRQAQIRYTSGPFSVALENPTTTVSNVATAARNNAGGSNFMPDLTARWVTKGDWGHLSVAGLLRQLKSGDESDTGAAVSVSGRFNLGASDDIRWMANYGAGIGRYLAFGLGADAVLDANGELHAQDGAGGFVAWRHAFSPKLRSNLMYSVAEFDNDRSLAGWGPASWSAVERAQSFHANLIYSPFPKLDIGAELSWGQRSLEDDREGDLRRVHTTVKYSF